jgi:hypothetical protein
MRVKLLGGHLALGAAIVLAVSVDAAHAQQVQQAPERVIPERQSVLDRARPDYDPLGIRLGSFLAYPTARLAETYDSNVFATTTGTKDDFYTTFNPGIGIRSDWNVHSVALQASTATKRYSSLVSENVTNLLIAGNGRLDILRDIYVRGGAGYQLLHEDRSSPDSVNGKKPVEYHLTSANLGYVHEPGRLGARVDATVDSYSFNNASTNTGATILQKDRDRIVYTITPRVAYEIVPGYHAFAQASGNDREYVQRTDQRGFHRTSHGYEVDVGTAIDFTHLINGEVYVGYLEQFYADTRLKTNRGVGFGANLLWNVTQLTSLRATMARTVEETTQFVVAPGGALVDASGYLQTAIKLTAEHELLRNVLLSAYASYLNADYNGITRTDDQYEANIEGRYLINRILTAAADFTYTKRDSNVIGVKYDRAIAMLSLRAGF